jgi:hypothetical protein
MDALPVKPTGQVQLKSIEGGGRSVHVALIPHGLDAHALKSVGMNQSENQNRRKADDSFG